MLINSPQSKPQTTSCEQSLAWVIAVPTKLFFLFINRDWVFSSTALFSVITWAHSCKQPLCKDSKFEDQGHCWHSGFIPQSSLWGGWRKVQHSGRSRPPFLTSQLVDHNFLPLSPNFLIWKFRCTVSYHIPFLTTPIYLYLGCFGSCPTLGGIRSDIPPVLLSLIYLYLFRNEQSLTCTACSTDGKWIK